MRKLLIALVVLAVLFVAVDRIALVIAEDEIASRIATAYSLPTDPGVSITGFPFLTQVVSGNYQQIGVTADQIQADGVTLHNPALRSLSIARSGSAPSVTVVGTQPLTPPHGLD